MYADARRLVAEQVKAGYVLYGPYTFTITTSGPTPPGGGTTSHICG